MHTRRWILLLVMLMLALGGAAAAQEEEGDEPVDSRYAGSPEFPAPDFPQGLDWLNVSAPLSLEDLRGKVVVLDFWTYGCINCIHMIPTLRRLEEKYPDELVVIGVHSAKFENEGETENIREIVQRYELEHPVINDNEFRTWGTYRPYGVNAWPTFVIIDPRGNLLAVQAGEIPFEAFDRVISGMVAYFDSTGELNREPIELSLEGEGNPNTALAYPGKVLADPEGNRLFIADSNHHRIVIADLTSYEVLDIIGTGARGFDDGGFDEATFNKPQGMDIHDNTLYVADTENHAIRAVDLEAQTVSTIAGNGQQSYERNVSGSPSEVGLSSPWDVLYNETANELYIAMAGPHQLWVIHFDEDLIEPLVGSGREGLVNTSLRQSELAQPSGLHLHGDLLYFADSESSSIRVADLANDRVETVSGPAMNDLFSFGDVDGGVGTSRLQHPLGVTGTEDGTIYIADTYNSRIKRIDPETKTTTTVYGLAQAGFRDGGADEAQFYEPGGLDYADGKLYVADTNNHAIRVIDLEANMVSTVMFPNPEVLQIAGEITVAGSNSASGEQLDLPEQTVAPGEGEIVLNIVLPEGYKINELAPSLAEWRIGNDNAFIAEEDRIQSIDSTEVRVPVRFEEGEGDVLGYLNVYYCEAEEQTLCYLDEVRVHIPVSISADADGSVINVERSITPPQVTLGGLE